MRSSASGRPNYFHSEEIDMGFMDKISGKVPVLTSAEIAILITGVE